MYRLFFLIPLFFLCSWVNPFSKYEWQSTDNGLKIWTDKGAKVKYHWDGDSRGGVIHGTGTLTISGRHKSSEKINAYYGTINEKGLFNNEAYSQKYIGRLKNWPSSKTEEYDGFGILILKNGDAIISEFEHDFLKSNAETYIYKNDDLIHQGICKNSCNSGNINQDEQLDTNKNIPVSRCFALCSKPIVAPPPPTHRPGTDEPGNSFDFSILKKLFRALLIILLVGVLAALFIAFPQGIMIILAGLLIAAVAVAFALLLWFIIKGFILLILVLLRYLIYLLLFVTAIVIVAVIIKEVVKSLQIKKGQQPKAPLPEEFKTFKNSENQLIKYSAAFIVAIAEIFQQILDGKNYAPNSKYGERLKCAKNRPSKGCFSGVEGESDFVLNEPIELEDDIKVTKMPYKNGIPDFSKYVIAEVEIDNMGTERKGRGNNFEQADAKLAEQWTKEKHKEADHEGTEWTSVDVRNFVQRHNITRHELNNMKTVQYVPFEINAAFPHLGGVAECKRKSNATPEIFKVFIFILIMFCFIALFWINQSQSDMLKQVQHYEIEK